jgi:twitching motility protein PilT
MNRASEILDFLSKSADVQRLVLAPNAPAVSLTDAGVEPALNRPFDAADISDTLTSLKTRAWGSDQTPLAPTGHFSFGLKGIGRFRISHTSQRGSKALCVTRISYAPEETDDLCTVPQTMASLHERLSARRGGVLGVYGPSMHANSQLVYALLRRINHERNTIIYIVERELSFLLNNDCSIVVQAELGVDVASMAAGLEAALWFAPEIILMGNVRNLDEIPHASEAFRSGVLLVLSSAALNGDALVRGFDPSEAVCRAGTIPPPRATAYVVPSQNGKLAITVKEY